MTALLPCCRHREVQTGTHWVCRSPRLVIPGGLVTASDCLERCPFVDHELDNGEQPSFTEDRSIPVPADGPTVAVALVSAPRAVNTLPRTILELRTAGFSQIIHVFGEPGTPTVALPEVEMHLNDSRRGAWGNWKHAAATMLEATNDEIILLCQDDLSLAPCAAAALRHAIDVVPRERWGYVSLYTPRQVIGEAESEEGWRAAGEGIVPWGALALAFPRPVLDELLRLNVVRQHAGDRGIDGVVTAAIRSMNRACYFHVPSLVEHVGQGISTLHHAPLRGSVALGFTPAYNRYRFEGPSGTAPGTATLHHPHDGASARISVRERSVSVVIPTYNCGRYLADCLESFMEQSARPEVIVVDDGSTDGTADLKERFDGPVRWLSHDVNRGANAARNTGLEVARGDWVLFADADARYHPSFVSRLRDAADQDADVIYSSWNRIDVSTGRRTLVPARPFHPESLWWNNFISMCSLVRRDATPDRLPETGYYDDWKLWLELAEQGREFRAVDEVLFTAYERPEGKTARLRNDEDLLRREIAAVRRRFATLIGMEEPIAVVIPACGAADLTRRCLEHLARYAGIPFEVIYVDNGSASSVVREIEDVAGELGLTLAVIRNRDNLGFTAAVNQGLRLAAGRHVLCLNNDCFIAPECLERMYWHLTREERVAAVGPLTCDGGHQSLQHPPRRAHVGIAEDELPDLGNVLACARKLLGRFRYRNETMLAFFCTLMHRDALSLEGLLDERHREFASGLGADDEWCHRLLAAGWELRLALDAYAIHLGSESFQRLGIDRKQLQQIALEKLKDITRGSKSVGDDHAAGRQACPK
jgi:glycosyltransferase involved in cell wall biosynthesis